MAEKGVYITGEVLDLFWDCLDEDILDNEFQEQIENVLKEVKNLEKHYILVKPALRRILSVFHFSRFLFSNFQSPLALEYNGIVKTF